jgi:hypothetical protein
MIPLFSHARFTYINLNSTILRCLLSKGIHIQSRNFQRIIFHIVLILEFLFIEHNSLRQQQQIELQRKSLGFLKFLIFIDRQVSFLQYDFNHLYIIYLPF